MLLSSQIPLSSLFPSHSPSGTILLSHPELLALHSSFTQLFFTWRKLFTTFYRLIQPISCFGAHPILTSSCYAYLITHIHALLLFPPHYISSFSTAFLMSSLRLRQAILFIMYLRPLQWCTLSVDPLTTLCT